MGTRAAIAARHRTGVIDQGQGCGWAHEARRTCNDADLVSLSQGGEKGSPPIRKEMHIRKAILGPASGPVTRTQWQTLKRGR